MLTSPLGEFINTRRDELLRRCRDKVANQSTALSTEADRGGVPRLLDHGIGELNAGHRSSAKELGGVQL